MRGDNLNIKKAQVAGIFYPNNENEIQELICQYNKQIPNDTIYKSRLVIAPHAGYRFSGFGTYLSLKHLSGNNIFIFAPAHKHYVEGIALCNYDYFETVAGKIPVDKITNNNLINNYKLECNNEAFEDEHAIEVMLPFLSLIKDDIKIIPILVGNCSPNLIYEIISDYYHDDNNSFIISSDLSHFLSNEKAVKTDNLTANMIENCECRDFQRTQACNASAICGAVSFAKSNNFSFIRLDMRNSSQVTNDKNSVVGYGSWILYEGEKNHYIKLYYADYIKNICYKSIKQQGKIDIKSCPSVLKQCGACFVTLEKNNALRGCIGSIVAYRELIYDLIQNAYLSAYKDPRFLPIRDDEINEITIKISLLSPPDEIFFDNEEDLLNKIVPFKDGIILSDANKRAVYLPSVWEQLPDKKMFINSLKQKAGFNADYFSNSLRAYKFYSEYI